METYLHGAQPKEEIWFSLFCFCFDPPVIFISLTRFWNHHHILGPPLQNGHPWWEVLTHNRLSWGATGLINQPLSSQPSCYNYRTPLISSNLRSHSFHTSEDFWATATNLFIHTITHINLLFDSSQEHIICLSLLIWVFSHCDHLFTVERPFCAIFITNQHLLSFSSLHWPPSQIITWQPRGGPLKEREGHTHEQTHTYSCLYIQIVTVSFNEKNYMIPKWLESIVEHIQYNTEETKIQILFSWFLNIF